MATIIDALVVTLGLDPKNFKKGVKETEDGLNKVSKGGKKAGSDIEAAGKKGAAAVAGLRNEILRMGAALLGMAAIKSFVASVTQSDAALGRMANNLDTTTENLSAWQGVAERTGGSAAGMAGAMKGLSQAVQRFSLTGEGGEVFKYFRAIGVAVTDSRGKMKSYDDILLNVADKFQGMDPEKAQAIGAGMGFDEGTVNVLMQGRAALVKLLEAQREMNVRTDEDTKNAIARDNAWKNLKDTFNRMATDILNGVTPALVGLMNFVRDHAGPSAVLITAMTTALTAMSLVRFGGLLGSLAQLGGAFAGAAGQAGLLASVGGKMGLWGAAAAASGTVAFLGTQAIMDATGATGGMGKVGGWLWDKINGNGPSMAGGYVPGTVKGMGNRGGGSGMPRGFRNNNPGNLEFANQDGASREAGEGRFAAFGSMEAGIAALDKQLHLYGSRGVNTLRGVMSKYAPAGENNTAAYLATMMRTLGVSADSKLNFDDPETMRKLIGGIAQHENGRGLSVAQINAGMDLYTNRRGGPGGGNTNTSATHIHGDVVVQTAATDARGIASTIHSALADQDLATQANTGLY